MKSKVRGISSVTIVVMDLTGTSTCVSDIVVWQINSWVFCFQAEGGIRGNQKGVVVDRSSDVVSTELPKRGPPITTVTNTFA